MLGVQPIHQALAIAKELDLDLVEVNPKSSPPVCRIMDFGKYKYEKKKQEAAARKKRTEVELKEVKIRPKTDEHDFNFKMRHVRRFLADGNKAKITIRFRGRELAHPEVAKRIFDRIIEEMTEVAVLEQSYRMEGRTMTIILAPKGVRAVRPEAPPRPEAAAPTAAPPSAEEVEDDLEDDDEDDDDDLEAGSEEEEGLAE